MMLTELYGQGVRATLVAMSGIGSLTLIADAQSVDERIFGISVGVIRELGSFGLIACLVLGALWLIKKAVESAVPALVRFLENVTTSFLEELKKTREEHTSSLREERAARERLIVDFREMLQSHKGDIGKKMDGVKASIDCVKESIDEGNDIVSSLVTELSQRPCQLEGGK